MQTKIVKEPKILGKRSISSKQSTPLALSEKSNAIEIEEKIKKNKRKKTIFTKEKQYCTCSPQHKTCNLPVKKKKKNYKRKEI